MTYSVADMRAEMELRPDGRSPIDVYIGNRFHDGLGQYCLRGGRRSGKTWGVMRFLCHLGAVRPIVANVASMTGEQGRLGAYADAKTIFGMYPAAFGRYEVFSQPREIRHPNGTRIFFNSYQNSETAKGIACDYLFINEANNFSQQQYTDLLANVREGVFLDFNPNVKFWVDDFYNEADICNSTWKNNPYLTDLQLQYFAKLRERAEAANASALDIRNYKVYYCGEYSELKGNIFTSDNLHFGELPTSGLHSFAVFCDPSALRGADYFAAVLSCLDAYGKVLVVDTFSVNGAEGETRESVCRRLKQWCSEWDVSDVYVETNGLVGLDFFDYGYNSGLPVKTWYSKGSKFERICSAFGNLTENTVIRDTDGNRQYCEQVYEFAEKCEHDDNVDALVSTYNMQKYFG